MRAKTYSYRYVGLDTLTADLRPVLQAHGLAVVQEAADDGVRTRIIHASGEWLEFGPLTIPAANDAQARVGDLLRPAVSVPRGARHRGRRG